MPNLRLTTMDLSPVQDVGYPHRLFDFTLRFHDLHANALRYLARECQTAAHKQSVPVGVGISASLGSGVLRGTTVRALVLGRFSRKKIKNRIER